MSTPVSRKLALCLAACGGISAHAAETTLPTVDVSATQATPAREDLAPDSVRNPYLMPVSNRAGVETFTAEDIEALKPRDVFDLLDKATGITVTYQGRRNPFFVKQRGGGSFTYIVDGAILPTVTQRMLQKIPLAAIEELQVVRDATALTLAPLVNIGASGSGDGLNTGFIIIRTRQPKKDEVLASAALEQGDGQPWANKESLFAGKRFAGEGASGYLAGLASHLDQPSQTSWFDGQEADAQMVSGGLRAGGFSLDLMAYQDSGRFEMQRAQAGLATAAVNQMKWYYDPIDTKLFTLNGTMAWNPVHTTLFSLFSTEFTQTERDGYFPPYGGSITDTMKTSDYWEKTQGFSLRHHIRVDRTTVQLGAQHTRSWAEGSSGPTPSTKWDVEVDGLGATVEQRLLDDRLFLDAGLRRDKKHVATASVLTSDPNGDSDLPAARAASFGARWQATPTYALNGRYFTGDQGTNGDFNIRSATGALHGEKQRRFELGVAAAYAGAFAPRLTWFKVETDNAKTQSTATYTLAGQTYYYYTEADNERTGFELLVQGQLAPRTRYKASWTHLYRNISSDVSVAQTTAGNLCDFNIEHGWGAYTFNASLKQVGPYDGGGPGVAGPGGSFAADGEWHRVGDYTRLDAKLSRDFRIGSTALKATLYGRNLGDVHYMTIYPWPDRGRTLGVELAVEL